MARPAAAARGGGRRGGVAKQDKSGAWLTTYADAVTLLMAFFVMLYAMSEIDVVKFTAFLQGLRVPFGNESGEGLLPATDGLQPQDTPTPPATERPELPDRLLESLPEELRQANPEQLTEAQVDALERKQAAHDQLDLVAATIQEALAVRDLELFVEQRREERGLVVSIASDDVLFAIGSTEINTLGREVIEVVSETLDGFPNPLIVEGHTDDVPLRRAGYTNWNLSTDRAVAVLSLMIEEHGLPPDRVAAAGYGEYHPLAANETADGRARNRRVDIVVLLQEVEA